jgi:molybdopterin molybdotransferase
MISVTEAHSIIQKNLPIWGKETATLEGLASLTTSEALLADRDYPPFNRATMDGICVTWEGYENGRREFEVSGICAAGTPIQKLTDNEKCFEIMTGAPLPEGAGLVIPYEDLKIENKIAKVIVDQKRIYFENIHHQGSDCKKNSVVLEAGRKLKGPHWGIATSFGYDKIQCEKLPSIKIISTGDEIVEVASPTLPHQIRRSNAYALRASLLQHGYGNVDLDHLVDDIDVIRKNYLENAGKYDVLIYIGGVSKGKFDYLPQVWNEMGVKKHFHEVSQRPGKPLWFGTDEKNKTIIWGLPGNPISCLVCLHRYFLKSRVMYARLTGEVVFEKNLTYFLPVKITFDQDGIMLAAPLKTKNSGEFVTLAESDGFVELPLEKSIFKVGESFRFYPWGRL